MKGLFKMTGRYKLQALAACALTMFAGMQHGLAAPAGLNIPDAGSVSANVDQEREWVPKADDPDIQVDLGRVEDGASDIRIYLNELRFTGEDVPFSTKELKKIVADDVGREVTFADLQRSCRKISDFLHTKGYMTAIAYLPTQDIVDGVVTIDILIGKYGTVAYDNTSELTTGRADGLAHAARTGKIIRKNALDRSILTLNDVPGIRSQVFISPSKTPNRADALFKIITTERCGGITYVDNYGSRFTGRWRIGAGYHWNNLSHVGDQLNIAYLQSFGRGLQSYDVRYELPVGNNGTFAGIEFMRTDYTLGEQFSSIDAYGTSHGWKIYSRTPWKRTLNNNLYWRMEASTTTLSDRMREYGTDSEKHGWALRFGLDGDSRNERSASSYKLMHTVGHINPRNDLARSSMRLADTEGGFQKTTLDLYHIQKFSNRLSMHASFVGQYAWSNLDSSEKFYTAGYHGVRAFPQGESGGDHGFVASAELRWATGNPHWQLAAFYDLGWSKNRNASVAGSDSRTLAGAGIGIIWADNKNSYARIDYAFPLTDHMSNTYGHDIGGTVWFQFVQKI